MRTTVFGASGLLGSALVDTAPFENINCITSKDVDLTQQIKCDEDLSKITNNNVDLWINAAARVGGVKANTDYIGEFYNDNVVIGSNVINFARRMRVKKLVSILSTCIYPNENVIYPLTEDQLHNGPPHHSNFGYAYAKRMLDVMSRAYRQQWGCDFVTVVPNNLFGFNDNYDVNNGHVIPSLIRKFYESHLSDSDVIIWGTGKPLREFTFAPDAAQIIWWVSQNYCGSDPINIGNTTEISIGDLATMIGKIIGFKGNIKFDTSKPDGQYRKPSSNNRLRRLGCEFEYTDLQVGLEKTIDHFIKNYPSLRGV